MLGFCTKEHCFKGNVKPAGFPAGIKLALEEREQEYDQTYYLLVAQLKLYSQFKHGINLVCAGLQANLLKVGIYKAPCLALALGLPRMALSVSLSFSGLQWPMAENRFPASVTGLVGTHFKPCSYTAAWVTSPSSLPRTRLCEDGDFET